MQLTLSEEEAAALREILASELSDLRVEIRRTDTHDVRERLRVRERLLDRLLAELGAP
jgi:hypothetical protein